jgi:multicomponent Na+:H+ antiporter subunit B
MHNLILRTISRIIVPFALLYGIFIIMHGHLSPGGGFSGGAMIGAGLILYTLVFGAKAAATLFPPTVAEWLETGGILVYIATGLVGVFTVDSFLSNINAGFGFGTPGTLFSAGMIPILMIAIGIKVASTMMTLFRGLLEEPR